MIELTTNLSECVRRELKISDEARTVFTEEELARVSVVSISRADLDVIKYFRNLSVLELTSFPSLTSEDVQYIGSIIPSIVSLKIKEQNSIYRLDLSNFVNLKELAIIHNDNIVDVIGTEGTTRLTIYDNKEYRNIKQIVEYLNNHPYSKVNLDIVYYIGIKRCGSVNISNVNWVESLGLRQYIVHDYDENELKTVMDTVADVVSKYIHFSDTPIERFTILYEWMIKNIKFINEDEAANDVSYKTDNSYHALTYKEGGRLSYAKLFQLLLEYAGVDSYIVYSYGALDSIGFYNGEKAFSLMGTSDYALLRVCLNNRNYYCDIAWDSMINDYKYAEALRMFLLSKDELKEKHHFIGEGNVVNSYSYHGDDSEDLLMRAANRIKETDAVYKEIDLVDAQIFNYNLSMNVRKDILNNKGRNNSFEYPGEDKVLSFSIKADDNFINQLNNTKKEIIRKYSGFFKTCYIPNNLDTQEEINEYINGLFRNYVISKKLFNILTSL